VYNTNKYYTLRHDPHPNIVRFIIQRRAIASFVVAAREKKKCKPDRGSTQLRRRVERRPGNNERVSQDEPRGIYVGEAQRIARNNIAIARAESHYIISRIARELPSSSSSSSSSRLFRLNEMPSNLYGNRDDGTIREIRDGENAARCRERKARNVYSPVLQPVPQTLIPRAPLAAPFCARGTAFT